MKILLKICFFSLFFISQSFSQSEISGTLSQSQSGVQNGINNNVAGKPKDNADTNQPPKDANAVTNSPALSRTPKIVSSINPIYQIAKFISGDEKNNSLLVNPRASEHNYQFRTSDINTLNNSDVVFYIGDNLEGNLPKALSSLKKQPVIVQLIKSKNIKLLTFQSRPDEDNTDPHIWLNSENAAGIAMDIADTLSKLYPAGAATYKKNLERFVIDVKNMDEKNKIELFKVRERSFIVDHNSTAYFENYYAIPSAGVIRYYYDQDLTLKDITRINNLIKKERAVCVLGSFQERGGLAMQIAANNKIKFALIDIMGNELNYNQNGYTKMMSALVSDLVKCVNK
jgi:zinc transport system substrate-binding protein